MNQKRGLQLDRVVLLGRTFDEYAAFFGLSPEHLAGRTVLDVASGVSSFSAEARQRGILASGADPIYAWEPAAIETRCEPDLRQVFQSIQGLTVYRWGKGYDNPEQMQVLRRRAYQTFLRDYAAHRAERYFAAALPELPFADGAFEVTLVSYLLFAYDDKFSYDFHRAAILELMRVTSGELRIYPMVNFEGERCVYVDQLKADPALRQFHFEEVPTEFEFLIGSNAYLKITHAR